MNEMMLCCKRITAPLVATLPIFLLAWPGLPTAGKLCSIVEHSHSVCRQWLPTCVYLSPFSMSAAGQGDDGPLGLLVVTVGEASKWQQVSILLGQRQERQWVPVWPRGRGWGGQEHVAGHIQGRQLRCKWAEHAEVRPRLGNSMSSNHWSSFRKANFESVILSKGEITGRVKKKIWEMNFQKAENTQI